MALLLISLSADSTTASLRTKVLNIAEGDKYNCGEFATNNKFKARLQLEVYISDYLQKNASPQDLEDHIDIADWLVRWKNDPDTDVSLPETPIQPIHQAKLEMVLNELREYWSEETVQAVAPLVEELDLEIKSITAPPWHTLSGWTLPGVQVQP